MARTLVERTFDPPLDEETRQRLATRLAPCLERSDIRWVRSFLARDRRRMICHFEAPDAGSVRMAFRSAGLPFVRVWTAEILTATGEELARPD